MKCLAIVVLLLPLIQGRSVSDRGCHIGLNTDLPVKNEPLFLQEDDSGVLGLLRPEAQGKNGYFQLESGESVVISCPGKKNNLLVSKQQTTKAECVSGTILLIDGEKVEANTLDCKSRVDADVIQTGQSCADGEGSLLELGFKVDDTWHKLVDVCHDIDGSKTLYETHVVLGSVIEGKVMRSSGRPAFSRGEKWLFKGFNVDNDYKVKNQQAVLEKTVGKKMAAVYLDQKATKFMARGHLAPDADFPLSPWQLLTYFYVNAAPQWQSINAGNWLRTETNTRNIAAKLGVDLEVTSGTYGVSTMTDGKGEEQEIYMESKNKLPVPENYWKVLRNPKDNSCMGIVASNNPFLESAPETICTDVCEVNNWPSYKDDLFKGYVYCCDYDDLKSAIPYVPEMLCSSSLQYQE